MNVGMLVSNEVVRDTRVLLEAKSLARHGHRVRIVGWDRFDPAAVEGPIGDGIEVALVRTRGLLKALPGSLFRNPAWWRRAYRRALAWPADLWYAHDLDTLPAGVWLKARTGRPLVYDAHEIFAEIIVDDYPGPVVRAAKRLEVRLLPHVDHVVAANRALAARYETLGKPATAVMNCRDEVAERYSPPTAPQFTVLYVGTLHRSRFLVELVRAAQEVEGVHLRIGGQKALSEVIRRACEASDRTTFLGPVLAERVIPLTMECHVVSTMIDPTNVNYQIATPNKIFEAMAAGRPLLATQGTASGDIVEREGCGLAIPYDLEACKEALRRLRDNVALRTTLGENGLRAAHREYNWSFQERGLLAAVERFAS